MKHTLKLVALVVSTFALAGFLRAGPPSAADVGDAESFGHAAQYMGAASGDFSLRSPCPAGATNCTNLDPTGSATFTALDNCRIKLPKKATRTIIYPALNFFVNYELENNTGVFQPVGRFSFRATVDIESDVLLDPSIIDPATGAPAAGKLIGLFTYNYTDDRAMQIQDRQRQQFTLVRVGNAGINKAALVALGLSEATVDALFNKAMTVRMNVTGDARLCNTATVTTNMRLFGD